MMQFIVAQSISALDSCYEKWGRFETLKKWGTQIFVKKQVAKTGSLLFKKEEAAWSFLFLNNNHPDFCTLLFEKKQGTPFFSGLQTDPTFHNKNQGQRLTGQVCQLIFLL